MPGGIRVVVVLVLLVVVLDVVGARVLEVVLVLVGCTVLVVLVLVLDVLVVVGARVLVVALVSTTLPRNCTACPTRADAGTVALQLMASSAIADSWFGFAFTAEF